MNVTPSRMIKNLNRRMRREIRFIDNASAYSLYEYARVYGFDVDKLLNLTRRLEVILYLSKRLHSERRILRVTERQRSLVIDNLFAYLQGGVNPNFEDLFLVLDKPINVISRFPDKFLTSCHKEEPIMPTRIDGAIITRCECVLFSRPEKGKDIFITRSPRWLVPTVFADFPDRLSASIKLVADAGAHITSMNWENRDMTNRCKDVRPFGPVVSTIEKFYY